MTLCKNALLRSSLSKDQVGKRLRVAVRGPAGFITNGTQVAVKYDAVALTLTPEEIAEVRKLAGFRAWIRRPLQSEGGVLPPPGWCW